MAFRGWFALNTVEIANSSRVIAHLGRETPTSDAVFGVTTECGLTEDPNHPGLFLIPGDSIEVGEGLWRAPNGSRIFGPGLFTVGECWGPAAICSACDVNVDFDDSWDGLADFLGDGTYRPELAPWFSAELPESGEFGGVWVLDATGLDVTPVQRPITETVGHGGVAGPHRDTARTIGFDALLIGCSNAGVKFGLDWLTGLLRSTTTGTSTKLRFLNAHPGGSAADAGALVRELSGVVLTRAPEVKEQIATGSSRQATVYRVTWEMTALDPYAYLPAVSFDVVWDQVSRQPINWIHAADCSEPEVCVDMPVMFSTECVPEEIPQVRTPPPVCGGCLPVSGIDKYVFRMPTMDRPFRGRETAVTVTVRNRGESSLSLQGFWRVCGADVRCEDNVWPLQISGLPGGAGLVLDGTTGRFWADYDGRKRRPVGVVGTPNGAPWRPPLLDRQTCWDFVVQTSPDADFSVSMVMADREP